MSNFNDILQNYGSTGYVYNYQPSPLKYPQTFSQTETEIEMSTLRKKVEDNLQSVNIHVNTLLDGNNKVNQTLADQSEQLKRISKQANNLNKDIDKASNKASSISSKLNRRVLPLYFCIIAEFVVIVILLIAFSKSMYCLLTY